MQPISRRAALPLGGIGLACTIVGGIGLTRQGSVGFMPAVTIRAGRADHSGQCRRRATDPSRDIAGTGSYRRPAGDRSALQRQCARADAKFRARLNRCWVSAIISDPRSAVAPPVARHDSTSAVAQVAHSVSAA